MRIKLLDIHAHLTWPSLQDKVADVLDNCVKKGLAVCSIVSVNYEDTLKAIELKEKLSKNFPIKFVVFGGIYPNEIKESWLEDLDKFEKLLEENKIQGVGEVGLDKSKYTEQPLELQREVFSSFAKLAKQYGVPLNIHSRGYQKEVLDVLENINYKKVILHYFEAKKNLVKEAIERKYYLTIPSNIYKSKSLQENVNLSPLNRLLTETDSPFLKPEKDMEFNVPCSVIHALKYLSEVKYISLEEASNIIMQNFIDLFS